jgi:membrane protein implicated in regulation of membrane protease activity
MTRASERPLLRAPSPRRHSMPLHGAALACYALIVGIVTYLLSEAGAAVAHAVLGTAEAVAFVATSVACITIAAWQGQRVVGAVLREEKASRSPKGPEVGKVGTRRSADRQ